MNMKIFNQQSISIKSQDQSAEYMIGSDLLGNLHKIASVRDGHYYSFLLLSDKTVFGLYGKNVVASLKKLNNNVITSVLPDGETSKNFANMAKIINPFFKAGFRRNSCLISLGGGVITDIGGFMASILLRGVDSIFLPTTLLAQVDAAVGGKTGMDLEIPRRMMYKNMIGTFSQPKAVISDLDVLRTLADKEIRNGLGEIVKYWAGWGRPSEIQISNFKFQMKPEKIIETISICQRIKIDIVRQDPLETRHVRDKLNLGHTIGHAIEGASNARLSHGECVAIGLIGAAKISRMKGYLGTEDFKLIIDQLEKLHLPTRISGVDKSKVLDALWRDKKGGTFVLLRKIGETVTNVSVENNIIKKVIDELII